MRNNPFKYPLTHIRSKKGTKTKYIVSFNTVNVHCAKARRAIESYFLSLDSEIIGQSL